MAILDAWTPGSIRKMRRHINEGMSIENMVRVMGVPRGTVTRAIKEIEEKDLEKLNEGFSKSGKSLEVDFGTSASHGYNAEFYKKARSQKRKKINPILNNQFWNKVKSVRMANLQGVDKDKKVRTKRLAVICPMKGAEIALQQGFKNMEELKVILSLIYDIRASDIISPVRDVEILSARQAGVLSACKAWPWLPNKDIGRRFGLDSSNVFYIRKKFKSQNE